MIPANMAFVIEKDKIRDDNDLVQYYTGREEEGSNYVINDLASAHLTEMNSIFVAIKKQKNIEKLIYTYCTTKRI